MTCTTVFCKAGDTKSGKMESRILGNLEVRFGGRLTRDPSGRSQPIPLDDILYDSNTRWPEGFMPPPSR